MCVLSLLSTEKKRWLQQRVELYGCELDLNRELFSQVEALPKHVVNQIILDVSFKEMYCRNSLCDQDINKFKAELDKVRQQTLSPQVFQKIVLSASNTQSEVFVQ